MGWGRTKATTRQDTAWRALTAILSGVLFDHNGVLVDVNLQLSSAEGGYASKLSFRDTRFPETHRISSSCPSEHSLSVHFIRVLTSSFGISSASEDEYFASKGPVVDSNSCCAWWRWRDLFTGRAALEVWRGNAFFSPLPSPAPPSTLTSIHPIPPEPRVRPRRNHLELVLP